MLGECNTVYGIVHIFFALKHNLIDAYFGWPGSNYFKWATDKRQLHPSYTYTVKGRYVWPHLIRVAVLPQWILIMKNSWVSRRFEALHVQLQLSLYDLWDATIPKYTFYVGRGARFVYLFQHICQQVCCCIFLKCNKWLHHNLQEQIPLWN